jgi:hypothetical protein
MLNRRDRRMRATLIVVSCASLLAIAGCSQRQTLFSSDAPPVATIRNAKTGEPSFVGRWAPTAAACADGAWVLTAQRVQSPNGVSCTLVKLDPASAGYSSDVECGEAGHGSGRMNLTLSGRGASRGLTLEGGPIALPVSLTACPVVAATASSAPPRPAA